ncbi:winged helix-turn-helix domain-containing protein [Candidatus Enterococcus mansonii]|uniref:OmpR/PhoB-type domain-containing protein n=1 Tax=Candidatus Enterococcus mansonii TaxID=1834181 RepID=A0A242CGI2_9ENTE|nr:winged helix-turn-helix domain-containing protein [Enterococcus sp. 4G2_DIV0659]OTO09347.1 hypothetical protein A5880_000026 [Enterococcus sp. 4G2_DIV0659]
MYNVGFVLLDGADEKKYADLLKSEQLSIHLSSRYESDDKIENYHGIVIYEQHIQNIGVICEMIIDLKKKQDMFIWIISERANKMNHIVYLRLGADGIFDTETDPEEYKLLMTNAFNRYDRTYSVMTNNLKKTKKPMDSSDLQLRACNFSVVLNGKEINLTKLEFKTMEFLQTQPGVAVSYEEIYKNVWKDESKNKQYRVSNLIFHLRQKIEEDAAHPRYIRTVRSKGYQLML